MPNDLITVIKQKQAEIARLQAELDEAKTLLSGSAYLSQGLRRPSKESKPTTKAKGHFTPADVIVPGSAADRAVQAIRSAGHPLHAHDLVVAIEQGSGEKVKLATLVGSLSRWVKKKQVFYRAGRNVFGLIEMRKA
jgi:hypothetical protein